MAEQRSIARLSATIRASSEATGYSENYLRLLIARGDLAAIRVGRSVRIRIADLEDFLNRHRVAGSREATGGIGRGSNGRNAA